jgi:hypothetical protein
VRFHLLCVLDLSACKSQLNRHSGSNATFVALIAGHQLGQEARKARHSPGAGRSPRRNCPSTLAVPYLQKILVDGEAIGAVGDTVFSQIIFDILASWWPADG